MTAKEMIELMNKMENRERIDFLEYLYHEHFSMNPLTKEEMRLIDDLRDGYVKVVECE
ncbi:MAG: hypothetical protein FWF59_00940 [Turicibacter sp.]|nr:hypothetical protein [Turicibacter sp.]